MSRSVRSRLLVPAAALAIGSLAGASSAFAQGSAAPQVSHPVVQTVPGVKGMALNDALNRLARSPQDVQALIDAGKASLGLGDAQAAAGFFQRAATLAPGNAQVKAGLAGAFVLNEDPFSAVPLFDEAAKAGPIDPERLADRGLAYDLLGDNVAAQTYYRQSLASSPEDETLRRLALSQAIAGDERGMDLTLAPLLQRQDKSAWRTRAFGLAILGKPAEAEAIARQSMPADMANSLSAYLRYMPRLTAAQQAAAANLGHFPRAAEIGRDDPRLAQYARPRTTIAAASQTLTPNGAPLGAKAPAKTDGKTKAKPVPAPAATLAAAQPPALAKPHIEPSGELGPVKPVPAPVMEPAPQPAKPRAAAPVAPPPAPRARRLEDVFADFTPPSKEVELRTGAVDMRKLNLAGGSAAADEKAKVKAEKAKPSHPSRIWVQVATGRSRKMLALDWGKMVKADPKVFKGKTGYTSAWGQTNRLLTGPFETEAAADAYMEKLVKAGLEKPFMWTSPAGQVVDALPAGK